MPLLGFRPGSASSLPCDPVLGYLPSSRVSLSISKMGLITVEPACGAVRGINREIPCFAQRRARGPVCGVWRPSGWGQASRWVGWLCPLPSEPAENHSCGCLHSGTPGIGLLLSLFSLLSKLLFPVLLTGSICASSRLNWITCQDATRTPTGIPGW